jgi:uncharacterized protein YbbC (DUF1343 family)/CubicO group peptidase (beta-lactamase class C family)
MRHPPLVKSPMKAALLAGVALGIVTGCIGSVSAAMKPDKLQAIDREIEAAISRGEIPGAVLRIESKGEVYEKAYGKRLVSPGSEAMTVDTIFDLASLTKVMATTPSILKLVEDGRLSLDDPVAKWIPEFLAGGVRPEATEPKPVAKQREGITIRHLITHQSGLPPGIFLSEGDFWGYEEGVRRAATVGLLEKPGTRFRYSDVNFILLGEIVRRVSGERIEAFVEKRFFAPLGMTETSYCPSRESLARIAPTTVIAEYGLLRGQVHDPTARRMEGIAGHAGLFGTMRDVAIYTRFFLTGKRPDGQTLLHPDTITQATTNQLPADLGVARGLGWDISSPFGTQRGEKFPLTGFGHTGWTGTSIWVDPGSETIVILLTNRNHPSEAGKVKPLRARVGTLAAEAVGYTKLVPAPDPPAETAVPSGKTAAGDPATVLNGIDVLERDGFALLKGKKVGLVTNQTGINRQRRSTIDLLANAPEIELKVLFSPEHGIRGVLDQEVIDDEIDAATGLPVYSLYQSEKRKPTPAQLAGLDALVFDIQDIGCRFYTFVSTMGLAMEAAKEAGIRFVVLDRVNPIGGIIVDGPVRTGAGNDFVAFHEIPVQHGMTTGELARMFNAERKVGADLVVVPVEGWNPAMRFDETGLPWVNPSPNMRSLAQSLLYPGVGLVEFTNVSVGRGTHSPFEHIGAPWIHDGKLAQRMRRENLDGVEVLPDRFTPEVSVYKNEDCAGVRFYLSDREAFRPLDLGIELMRALHGMYPGTFTLKAKGNVLLRHEATIEAILDGAGREEIRELWRPGLEEFLKRRQTYLLYPRP